MFIKTQNEVDSKPKSEKEVKDSAIVRTKLRRVLDVAVVPKLEVPFSVKNIISRIEQAQLQRAREDINMHLNEIMNNVHRIVTRYAIDLNLSAEKTLSITEYKKKQRTSVLDKMITFSQNAEIREKTLAYILAWLEEWSAILSEMTVIDIDEHHHWIAQMEILPDTLKAIENNVKLLSRFSTSFLEEKKKQKKKTLTRGTLWKTWKERVIKRPATAHALRPDQMISNQFTTNIKISEIQDMLQELIGTSMFNKLENNAIKYISSTIINLSKALSLLNDELKLVNFQSANIYVDESSDKEKELSLKIIQDLSEENEMLQQKLQDAEEKYEQFLQTKVVTERQIYTVLPTSSTSKTLPGPSSQSSTAIIKAGDIDDNMERIFATEFGNTVDEAPPKVIKGSWKKWGSALSYIAQPEMIPGLPEKQQLLPEKKQKKPPEDDVYQKDETDQYQSQKRKYTEGFYANETSRSNLSDNKIEQKVPEDKPNQYSELQALEKKRKERKFFSEAKSKSPTESQNQHFLLTETKSQGGKDGTSSMWEQLRKIKHEYLSAKSPISSEIKVQPTTESMDKESKREVSSLVELLRKTQSDYTSESQKEKRKTKKHHISSESTISKEEKTKKKAILAFTKKAETLQLVKSHSRIAKESSESTRALESQDDKSEQSNLEEFQKAIMAFLKEKIDNIGKPFDKKPVLKEEELLKRAEVEKLGIIKAKMEEYFQTVGETVTKILRRYKDIKKEGQVEEKLMKQKKIVSFMPELHFQKSPTNAKSESSTFPLYETTDPVIHNLLQMILAETESERDVPTGSIVVKDHKEKEKQRQEGYLQEGQEKMFGISLKHQLLEKRNLSKESYEKIDNNLEEKKAQLQMKEGKQAQQKQKEGQDEVSKKQQKQRAQKQIEQDEQQKQTRKEEEEHQKLAQQQMEAWKQKMKEQGILFEKENGDTRQVQKDVRHLGLKMREEKEKEKQKPGREVEDLKRQRQNEAKDQMKTEEEKPKELVQMVTQTPVTSSPKLHRLLEDEGKEFHRNLRTSEIFPDQKNFIPILPSTSTQSSPSEALPISGQPLTKSITLTPQQAGAQGTTLTPQQARAQGITLTPQQARAQGITLTSQQAQDVKTTLTPQQAQDVKTTLTSQQAQDVKTTLTPQQAQDVKTTLTSQQAQDVKTTLTPQQARTQGITLTPQQAQDVKTTLTPQQAQDVKTTLTSQQAQDVKTTLTPQQAQDVKTTLTPQQAQDVKTTLTPQQAQDVKTTLTPQQAQDVKTTLTSQQAQDLKTTLTPQQAQDVKTTLTSQQAQDVKTTLTPQQARTQGITLTPQQAQDVKTTLTPQQAQDVKTTLTSQQAQDVKTTLTPQQAQDVGTTLTRQQARAQGITVTPQRTRAQGTTLTPQQARAQGITLTPQQAQDVGTTLTPQQAQDVGTTLTPQQARTQGITLTRQQARAQGITVTPQWTRAQGITLTPQQAQAQRITLTPQQAQDVGTTLTPQQAQDMGITLTHQQAQDVGTTLTPQQAQDVGITLTPQQAQAQGITLTPQQAQDLGIILTPKKPQVFGDTFTQEQAQALRPSLSLEQVQTLRVPITSTYTKVLKASVTSEQTQAMQIPLTTEQDQISGVPITQEQAKALRITLMPEQTQAFRDTFTPEQAQALEPLTAVQAQSLGLSLTPEQAQALGVPLTLNKAYTLGSPLTLEQVQPSYRPFQKLKPSLPTGQAITSRLSPSLRQSPASSAPITEEFSTFGISSTPLQISGPPLTQGPFAPQKPPEMGILPDPGKLLEPQTLPSSRQTLIYRGPSTPAQFPAPEVPPTPGQLPISRAPPTPGQPFVSGISPTSGQIPSLWAPISPGQPLVPGTSSIPEQLLESEPITFSELPQAFQPLATTEQSPYLQASSTLGQHLAPRTLPGQAPPLWIPSISRYPHPPLAPTTPGKPQKGLSSSVAKRRLAIISSLKSKSALVHPSAPDFKIPQVPLTTENVQMSEVSDTYEETQAQQDTFAIEPWRTFQSYLTNYRIPVSHTPYMKPITSLPSLTTQLLKTSQISPSERDQKSRFPWTSVSGTKKPKMMVPPSSPQGLEEKRYFVDVEAQRKNLILLNQAIKTSGLPSQLHTTARNLIIETLHMDTVRLGYVFRKYIAYRLIQRARNNIIKRLKAIQNTGKGYETQNLYITLIRIDDYQKKVMWVWTEKQKSLEQKRNQCLREMMYLFGQLQQMYELNLRQPIPLITEKKQILASTKPIPQPLTNLLIEDDRKSDMFKEFRQQQDQMEAIWNVDVSVSSYPIEEKTSMHSLWAQLGGYPDIPRLLQLDIQSTFRKCLASIQSQVKKIPK
ncbi:protein FAM186A [Lemur catta]|uniref:protein FAM186A n=1 Tax=Lemur catta TaxID=9447 RepID=UPI001E267860|nr:protein FAM186A [Lemur catta]